MLRNVLPLAALLAFGSVGVALADCADSMPYHLPNGTAASANAIPVKSGATRLCSTVVLNVTATKAWLKLYDTPFVPVCGSAVGLKHVLPIPADTNGAGLVVPIEGGELYQFGLGFCVVGGGSDIDASNAPVGVAIELSVK